MQQPSVGRVVHYRARTRGYVLAAIVTATKSSLDPEGVARGDVPALEEDTAVHLEVLTPGAQERYQEFNVALGDGPGQWSWPARV